MEEEPIEDKGTILRRMRRLTDYYDIHKEIGRSNIMPEEFIVLFCVNIF